MDYEMMTREELMQVVYHQDCADCADCPLAGLCADRELFWGCGVWEDQMGEDL